VAVADANNDGILDLLAVQADGSIIRISDKNEGQSWETAEIAKVPNPGSYLAGELRLRVADFDNNGALDLYLSSTTPTPGVAEALVWLGDANGSFTLLTHPGGPALVFDAADVGNDGHLDLLGLSADGQPLQGVKSEPEELSLAGGAGRMRSKRLAISASIRSGWAAKSRSAPACWYKNSRSRVHNFISDWESRQKQKWCG